MLLNIYPANFVKNRGYKTYTCLIYGELLGNLILKKVLNLFTPQSIKGEINKIN